MVVVALGEPGVPVISCAAAGASARKMAIKTEPEVNDFIFMFLSNLLADTFFSRP